MATFGINISLICQRDGDGYKRLQSQMECHSDLPTGLALFHYFMNGHKHGDGDGGGGGDVDGDGDGDGDGEGDAVDGDGDGVI